MANLEENNKNQTKNHLTWNKLHPKNPKERIESCVSSILALNIEVSFQPLESVA